MDFSEKDLAQAAEKGLGPDALREQLQKTATGATPVVLDRPCTLGDGLSPSPSPEEAERLAQIGAEALSAGRGLLFIPASGAASRMFAAWARVLSDGPRNTEECRRRAEQGDADARAALTLWDRFEDFAFCIEAKAVLKSRGDSWEALHASQDLHRLLSALLESKGLGFLEKPKAHIPFHRDGDGNARTAFQEQVTEALSLWGNAPGPVRLHFTVSHEHRGLFESAWKALRDEWATRGETVPEVSLSFSEQSPATDTIAGDGAGKPYRDADGSLVFRPGGHGSLLRNVEATGGDLVFLRNIDNIATASRRDADRHLRLALAGRLVLLQREAADLAAALESDSPSAWEAAAAFAARFGRLPPSGLAESERKAKIRAALNRPLRVCGMVRNEGEPGGGPFWVKSPQGDITPQIVESAQVDKRDGRQAGIFGQATHFNPVDCVLGLKDPQGRPYRLQDFSDPTMYLVSAKTLQGKPLQALEWPGLWNGSMAGWNTVFAEIPLSMFTPVKTALDLLRPEHQA